MSSRVKQWLHRFHELRANRDRVLTMNQRNLEFIYPSNRRRDYPLADNKLLTKETLVPHGIPMPTTYLHYSYFYEMNNLADDLYSLNDFVIKPANGSGGGGILVIRERRGEEWLSAGGKIYSLDEIRTHISNIIFGIHSFGLRDTAIIEARLEQHERINTLSPSGLADVRLILYRRQPAMAMIRLTTNQSAGRANLHQGAIGVGIDLVTGHTRHAIHKGEEIEFHPDTGAPLIDVELPYWPEILATGQKVINALPLNYLGIDIAITSQGPVLLEINVRPGIEIQNANNLGLRDGLLHIKMSEAS